MDTSIRGKNKDMKQKRKLHKNCVPTEIVFMKLEIFSSFCSVLYKTPSQTYVQTTRIVS
jgi:hypothetical protein